MPCTSTPLNDPTFPHGSDTGYQKGCRKHTGYPCPATPTCNEAHAAKIKEWKNAADDAPGEAHTKYVRNRLQATIAHAGIEAVLLRTGLDTAVIDYVLTTPSRTIAHHIGDPINQAWAWLLHGSDVTAPGFKHGVTDAYTRGRCRCRPCCAASLASAKRYMSGRPAAKSLVRDPKALAALRTHVQRLIDAGATVHQIGRAAGTTRAPVEKVLNGGHITYESAHALHSLTFPKVLAQARDGAFIPAGRTYWQIRTMWALGYSLLWQGRQISTDMQQVSRIKPDGYVTVARARQIDALAARVGDTPATPSDDLTINAIVRSRNAAAREGWYPPGAYDEDGTLNLRAIPNSGWATLDTWASTHVTATYYLTRDYTIPAALARVGLPRDAFKRLRHGLIYPTDRADGLDREASAARIAEIVETYEAMDDGKIGAVAAALRLGYAPGARTRKLLNWDTHPDVVAHHKRAKEDVVPMGEVA